MIDGHVHLNLCADQSQALAYLQECVVHGLSGFVLPSTELARFDEVRYWSSLSELVHPAFGLHPWFVPQDIPKAVAQVESSLDEPGVIALGEVGLDRLKPNYQRQQALLDAQLALAVDRSLPVILHSVKSHNDLLSHLKRHRIYRGVVHGFSGAYQEAKAFLDQGLYIGVGGTITYERAKKTREAIAKLPLDRLCLETDAPAMPILGRQGRANHPRYLHHISRALSELTGHSKAQVLTQSDCNLNQLFGLSIDV